MSTRASSPWHLGPLTVRNRILMAPVKTAFGDPSGKANDRHAAYFARRARGGAGAIILEPMFVDPRGKEHPKQLGLHEDNLVAPLKTVIEAIHAEGSLAVAHLNHAGRAANPKASGSPPEAPSDIPCPATGQTPEVMTVERVHEIVASFARAAARARQAGFDAIELQFGLGYLISQFWSPRTNNRTDEYGGNDENRKRFAHEVILAVREAAGEAMPVIARISAEEKVEGGQGIDDARELIAYLRQQGVSAIHVVSGNACDSPPWYYQHMSLPAAANLKLAARLRSATTLPMIVAGRMDDPAIMEEALTAAGMDAVALGRPLVADPDLPNKLFSDRIVEIAQCGACLQGCLQNVKAGHGIGCIINPEVGEEQRTIVPSAISRRIVVVGGGPAGMQAALTARQRGHEVVLFEANDELGGQFRYAPLSPGKQSMNRPFAHLPAAMDRAGVDVRLGVRADESNVAAEKPNMVIVATGAVPIRLPLPGLESAWTGEDVLTRTLPDPGNALVVGGGLIGVESAEVLAEKGWHVTVVELLEDVARDMEPVSRKLSLKRLASHNVEIFTGTQLEKLESGLANLYSEAKGAHTAGPFDLVVVAVGTVSVNALGEQLNKAGLNAITIGDANRPAQIYHAVKAGWEAAIAL